jgi:hypothetical protein
MAYAPAAEQHQLHEQLSKGYVEMGKSNTYRTQALGESVKLTFTRHGGSTVEGVG